MQPQTQTADKTRYASLWQRFVAVTLDEMITLVLFVPALILQIAGMGGNWPMALMASAAVLRYLYFVYFEHGRGQTIGKLLFKIRVRSEREDRLPLKEALLRNLRRFDVLLGLGLPADPSTAERRRPAGGSIHPVLLRRGADIHLAVGQEAAAPGHAGTHGSSADRTNSAASTVGVPPVDFMQAWSPEEPLTIALVHVWFTLGHSRCIVL